MAPLYATGDIVLIDTWDAGPGKVVVPGVIRYVEWHDTENDSFHYEANVYLDHGSSPSDQANVKWWSLSENEIRCKLGHVEIERPVEKEKGAHTFNIVRF